MDRKSLVKLKGIVEKDMKVNRAYLENFKDDNNQQVKELYFKALARIEAMEAVLQYCQTGEQFFFDKEGKE